ncbi:hypothetical protein OIV83_004987 [Microbotryomycetes sp. JL201]|nr:hypothetical protein OIV83_004987 [Microbotryomycetes sp. JL201]
MTGDSHEGNSPVSQSSISPVLSSGPRESAIPISPRQSVSGPAPPAVAPSQVPLSPRRLRPITIAPQPHVQSAAAVESSASPGSPDSPEWTNSLEGDLAAPPAKPVRSPLPPVRPARPGESRKLYNPGWSHPFPSSQLDPAPPRPPRPARPSEALMFVAPSDAAVPRTPEQQDAFDNERVDMEEYLESTEPPVPPAHPSSSPESETSPVLASMSGSGPRKNSIQRKPVPQYIASPVQRPGTPGRLSVGGFEALLHPKDKTAAGASQKTRSQELAAETHMREPFSPRVGLGLPQEGVSAREQRLAREQADIQNRASRSGGDLGEENLTSWSERMMQSEWFPSTLSKRLSLLPASSSPRVDKDAWKADGPANAAYLHGYSSSRNPSTKEFAPLPLHNTPHVKQKRGVSSRRTRSEPDFVSPTTDKGGKDLGEVVVMPSVWEDDAPDEDDVRRDPSFRQERMYFESIEYRNFFARIIHALYPFFVIAHIPATLFLDYNVIYTLAQLAIYPTLPSTSVLLRRDVVDVPTLQTSTAYYVALGVYAGCTFLWLVVVVIWLDIVRGFVKPWSGGGRVPIGQVYRSAAGFNYACMSKYERFCFMWRVRFAPFHKSGKVGSMVKDTRFSDGIADSCYWYAQNWPTVILLVPRAGLSLALLLLFGTTAYGSANIGPTERDNAYFRLNGTLTNFAQGVLLTNCVWAALRLLIVLVAAVGLFFFNKPFARSSRRYSVHLTPSREHLTAATPEIEDELDEKADALTKQSSVPGWISRRDRRIRAVILLCLRPSAHSSPAYSPFFKRKTSTDEWRTIDLDSTRKSSEARREERRRAELANKGANWLYFHEDDSPDGPRLDSKWGMASAYISPRPKLASAAQQRSAALSPHASSTSEYVPTPALPSGLHRRVRSVPVQTGENLTVGDQPNEDDTERVQVRFDVPKSTASTSGIRPLSLHLDNIELMDEEILRPQLRSHFSYISEQSRGSLNSGGVEGSVMRAGSFDAAAAGITGDRTGGGPIVTVQKPSPPSSVGSTPRVHQGGFSGLTTPALTDERPESVLTLGDRPSVADVRYAHTLELAQGVISRRRLSEQLLQEIKRLGEAEEAVRREERRLAALRRASEQTERGGASDLVQPAHRPISHITSKTELTAPKSDNARVSSQWSQGEDHYTSARSSLASLNPPPQAQADDGHGHGPGLLLPPFKLTQGGDEPTYELSSPTLNDGAFANVDMGDISSARLSPTRAPSQDEVGGIGPASATAGFLDDDKTSVSDDGEADHTGPTSVGHTPASVSRATFENDSEQPDDVQSTPARARSSSSGGNRPAPLMATPTAGIALGNAKPMPSPSANTFGGKKSRESRMPASPAAVASIVRDNQSPQEFPF